MLGECHQHPDQRFEMGSPFPTEIRSNTRALHAHHHVSADSDAADIADRDIRFISPPSNEAPPLNLCGERAIIHAKCTNSTNFLLLGFPHS